MNFEEMIFDYVDGSLDPVSENKLFEALTNNDELRSELRQQLAIRNAVSSDMKAFTPKAESTLKIFKALDIEPIPALIKAPAPVPVPGMLSYLGSIVGKFTQGIIGGLISAAATAVIMFYMLGNHPVTNLASEKGNTANYPVVSSTANSQENSNFITKSNTPDENVKVVYRDRIIYKEKHTSGIAYNAQRNDKAAVNEGYQEHRDDNIKNAESFKSFADQSPVFIAVPQSTNARRSLMLSNELPLNPGVGYSGSGSSSFELTGASYGYGMSTKVNGSNAIEDNMAIAYFYHFSNQFAIGMMYRREQFHQLYQGVENSKIYEYEQNPTLNNAFLTVRYSPEFLSFYNAAPFAEVSAGFNLDGIGFISRAAIGTELDLVEDLPVLIGIEWDQLRYINNNLSFYDYKYGVYLGLGYKF